VARVLIAESDPVNVRVPLAEGVVIFLNERLVAIGGELQIRDRRTGRDEPGGPQDRKGDGDPMSRQASTRYAAA